MPTLQLLNRVPGTVQAPKENFLEDLSKYTKAQLEELRDRQLKLLSNKVRLAKLPDKGVRIQQLCNRIEAEIKTRNNTDEAARLFSGLNIAEKGLRAVQHMEWNTKEIKKSSGDEIITAAAAAQNSDDDEESRDEIDPLKILAQSRNNVKTVKVVKTETSLITEADLAEIKSFTTVLNRDDTNGEPSKPPTSSEAVASLEPHARYICDNFQKPSNRKTKFLPFKTTKNDVHSVEKEKQRVKGKHWEVTAATPPIIRNSEAQLIDLKESIEVERRHKDELKSLMEQQAVERLKVRSKIVADNLHLLPPGSGMIHPNEFFKIYRDRNPNQDDESDEDLSTLSECYDDDEDEANRGGVSIVTYE